MYLDSTVADCEIVSACTSWTEIVFYRDSGSKFWLVRPDFQSNQGWFQILSQVTCTVAEGNYVAQTRGGLGACPPGNF